MLRIMGSDRCGNAGTLQYSGPVRISRSALNVKKAAGFFSGDIVNAKGKKLLVRVENDRLLLEAIGDCRRSAGACFACSVSVL
jgi:hypothetical protein